MSSQGVEARSVLVVGGQRAAMLASGLRRYGHHVLGPVETVEDALALVEAGSLDAAVLDLPQSADWSSRVADALRRRGVPYVFAAAERPGTTAGAESGEIDPTHDVVDALFRRGRGVRPAVGANRLLALMPPRLAEILKPHLTLTEVDPGMVLQETNAPSGAVHFPLTAVLSVVGPATARRPGAEIALIGLEGTTGIADILGGNEWPFSIIVQVGGETLVLQRTLFVELLDMEAELRTFLLRFVQAFLVQTGDTALANARGVLSQRLARRVLMTHDRVGADVLPLTHQQLATMLGVRRASVTEALHLLEGDGVVRSLRGRLLVRNRAALCEIASGYYGAAESAYDRLLGVSLPPEPSTTRSA